MKKMIKKAFAFLIIWICSEICLVAYQNDNVLIRLTSAFFSLIGYYLMY